MLQTPCYLNPELPLATPLCRVLYCYTIAFIYMCVRSLSRLRKVRLSKIQGVILKTNKLLKKLWSSTPRVVTRFWDDESFNVILQLEKREASSNYYRFISCFLRVVPVTITSSTESRTFTDLQYAYTKNVCFVCKKYNCSNGQGTEKTAVSLSTVIKTQTNSFTWRVKRRERSKNIPHWKQQNDFLYSVC